eukprot:gene5845-4168_t
MSSFYFDGRSRPQRLNVASDHARPREELLRQTEQRRLEREARERQRKAAVRIQCLFRTHSARLQRLQLATACLLGCSSDDQVSPSSGSPLRESVASTAVYIRDGSSTGTSSPRGVRQFCWCFSLLFHSIDREAIAAAPPPTSTPRRIRPCSSSLQTLQKSVKTMAETIHTLLAASKAASTNTTTAQERVVEAVGGPKVLSGVVGGALMACTADSFLAASPAPAASTKDIALGFLRELLSFLLEASTAAAERQASPRPCPLLRHAAERTLVVLLEFLQTLAPSAVVAAFDPNGALMDTALTRRHRKAEAEGTGSGPTQTDFKSEEEEKRECGRSNTVMAVRAQLLPLLEDYLAVVAGVGARDRTEGGGAEAWETVCWSCLRAPQLLLPNAVLEMGRRSAPSASTSADGFLRQAAVVESVLDVVHTQLFDKGWLESPPDAISATTQQNKQTESTTTRGTSVPAAAAVVASPSDLMVVSPVQTILSAGRSSLGATRSSSTATTTAFGSTGRGAGGPSTATTTTTGFGGGAFGFSSTNKPSGAQLSSAYERAMQQFQQNASPDGNVSTSSPSMGSDSTVAPGGATTPAEKRTDTTRKFLREQNRQRTEPPPPPRVNPVLQRRREAECVLTHLSVLLPFFVSLAGPIPPTATADSPMHPFYVMTIERRAKMLRQLAACAARLLLELFQSKAFPNQLAERLHRQLHLSGGGFSAGESSAAKKIFPAGPSVITTVNEEEEEKEEKRKLAHSNTHSTATYPIACWFTPDGGLRLLDAVTSESFEDAPTIDIQADEEVLAAGPDGKRFRSPEEEAHLQATAEARRRQLGQGREAWELQDTLDNLSKVFAWPLRYLDRCGAEEDHHVIASLLSPGILRRLWELYRRRCPGLLAMQRQPEAMNFLRQATEAPSRSSNSIAVQQQQQGQHRRRDPNRRRQPDLRDVGELDEGIGTLGLLYGMLGLRGRGERNPAPGRRGEDEGSSSDDDHAEEDQDEEQYNMMPVMPGADGPSAASLNAFPLWNGPGQSAPRSYTIASEDKAYAKTFKAYAVTRGKLLWDPHPELSVLLFTLLNRYVEATNFFEDVRYGRVFSVEDCSMLMLYLRDVAVRSHVYGVFPSGAIEAVAEMGVGLLVKLYSINKIQPLMKNDGLWTMPATEHQRLAGAYGFSASFLRVVERGYYKDDDDEEDDTSDGESSDEGNEMEGEGASAGGRVVRWTSLDRKPPQFHNSFAWSRDERVWRLMRRVPFLFCFEDRASLFTLYLREKNNVYYGQGGDVVLPRNSVFKDAFMLLHRSRGHNIHRISFVNEFGELEKGIGNGVYREFISSACKEGFAAEAGLFARTVDGFLYPNPFSYEATCDTSHLEQLNFLGHLVGRAMMDSIVQSVALSNHFVKAILGHRNTFSDLKLFDEQLYVQLESLGRLSADEVDGLCLTFTVTVDKLGVMEEVELIRGGRNIAVTKQNCPHYMFLMADFYLNVQNFAQVSAFRRGLYDLIPLSLLQLFDTKELMKLLCGDSNTTLIDVRDWEENTSYRSEEEARCPSTRYFWDAVASFTPGQRSELLHFSTGMYFPPVLGFKYLHPGFHIQLLDGDLDRLPSAATCFSLLKLPRYTSFEVTRAKVLAAIEECNGFYFS